MALLSIEGLTKSFAGVQAVVNVSFVVEPREIVGLIGPNGAGKTTLLNMVVGALPPTSGRVEYAAENLASLNAHEVARRGVVRTYQLTSVFSRNTVLDNIRIGSHLLTNLSIFTTIFNWSAMRHEETKVRSQATEILEFVGLKGKQNLLAGQLPYGDQRRLGIATALAASPKLLLLDEPAAGMNPEEVMILMDLIRTIRQRDITIVLVEHNMKMVMNLCNRVVVLDHGIKISEGTPREVSMDPEVISVYLGKVRSHAEN